MIRPVVEYVFELVKNREFQIVVFNKIELPEPTVKPQLQVNKPDTETHPENQADVATTVPQFRGHPSRFNGVIP